MKKQIILDETWVRSQVRIVIIDLGVTEANFERATEAARVLSFNRIRAGMNAYERSKKRSIDREVRHAGLFGSGRVRRSWYSAFEAKTKQLEGFALKAIAERFEEIKASGFAAGSNYWTLRPNGKWTPLVNLPPKPLSEMSPLEAEHWVTQVLLFLGASGATTTSFSQDGGVDSLSDHFAVQVKHSSSKVGVAAIREIFAVGVSKGKMPVLFSKAGFTSGAVDFGRQYKVLLFQYLPILEGRTPDSETALLEGLLFGVEEKSL